ncbi:hypothetical protein KXS07_22915 [Inquilinus limosus]|uniref:hypothetical protein n=1 Tax=Inquilinus limosus TaxID=171674 RepID=UPI003F13D8A0
MSVSYTEQLERESEQCRAALRDCISELRQRMTPGHVLDEVLGYTRDSSGAAFVENLKHRAVDNPLPLALVGTGLAWLMMGGGGYGRGHSDAPGVPAGPRPEIGEHAGADGSGGIGDMASRVGETAGDLGRQAGAAASAVGDSVSSAYESVAGRASRAGSALGDSAAAVGDRAASAARGFGQLWREQPLVVAGLGIAIGAALGTLLPATDFENRTLGSSRDKLKDEAEDFALRQLDKADRVAEHAVKEARDAAEREGLTGEAVVGDAVESLERGNVVPPPSDPSRGGA